MDLKESLKDVLRPAYRRYLAFKNKGHNVKCNICNSEYKDLRPVMGRHADGSLYLIKDHVGICWLCNSYPRMRQLWYWLESDYDIKNKSGIKILHVAPEVSISKILRKLENIEYVCIDKHCEGYRYPSYVNDGDVCHLHFKDDSFDLVLCNHVLEHVKDDSKAISEIFRVTKPGGKAILMVPIDNDSPMTDEEQPEESLSPEEREKRFGQFDHVRMYGQDYFERLKSAGFNVQRLKYNDELTTKFGFFPGEELVICEKPASLKPTN